MTLHRFMKVEGGDHLLIDVLLANENRHRDIIANAIEAESEEGIARVAGKSDLIWMKEFRDSDQDRVDIKRLKK